MINPFTVPACKISGLKRAHIHPCKQYIRWSYKKNLLSILCILIEVLSGVHEKGGGGGLNDFKFSTFIGRFPSDGAASMAVKELNYSTDTEVKGSSGRRHETDARGQVDKQTDNKLYSYTLFSLCTSLHWNMLSYQRKNKQNFEENITCVQRVVCKTTS